MMKLDVEGVGSKFLVEFSFQIHKRFVSRAMSLEVKVHH